MLSRHRPTRTRFFLSTPNPFTLTPARRLLITRPEKRPWRRRPAFLDSHRSLATAVDDPLRHHHAHMPLYHLRSFDPSETLRIFSHDESIPRVKPSRQGVPGAHDEMISVFEACLGVNRLERAAIILERMSDLALMSPSEIIVYHNQYLRAVIDRALEQPESEWAQSVHEWYEVQIRAREIPHTIETIACMLKVSLLSAQGSRLERLVTRYMDMIPRDSIYSLVEGGILNQQDFGTITNIYQPVSDLALEDWDSMLGDVDLDRITSGAGSTLEVENSTRPDSSVDSLPQVLPVPQKGLGLKTLRDVLSFFNQLEGQDLTKLSLDERREVQAHLERDCVDAAIKRWRKEYEALTKMGRNTAWSSNSALNSRLYEWLLCLEKRFKEDFDLIQKSETVDRKGAQDMERCVYGPFLLQSTPTRLAAVTIMGTLNSIAQLGVDKGIALSHILNNLSKIVEEDVILLARQRQREACRKRSQQGLKSTAPEDQQEIAHKTWPVSIRMKVGATLLSALLDSAKIHVVREHPQTKKAIGEIQPAFVHTSVLRKGKKVGLLMPNKALVEMMKREPRGDFLARFLPMLVEPRPWTSFDRGAFLESSTHLVRIKNGEKEQKIYAQAAVERGDMDQMMKGLDVLGRTAWQINKPVFEVLLEAWNSGESIANLPPLDPNIPAPQEPDKSDDPMAHRDWLRRVRDVENEKSGLHSERCFMNFQLEIARAFRSHTFYFPHNLDFRGRAYPIPAYLNHMGADHVRGLLKFATGKELGESGLRWLKVQLANVYGYDKASLDERESFSMDHLEDIYDSASSPLGGKRWWLTAEDPWQCLAACFELKAALESSDPTKYVSKLPVHQDGTCNGLQHYAALGGDTWGAQQVNLIPGDRPADVYSAVAELVQKSIAEDAANDNIFAVALEGKITRKVVKQTVMTNVYGVTFIGAKAQVLKQLEALYPTLSQDAGIPTSLLASYIATKIFGALSTMFSGAHDIQSWLGECAGRVCRALTPEQLDRLLASPAVVRPTKQPSRAKSHITIKKHTKQLNELIEQMRATIVWTTPLRMPIVQPYRKNGNRIVSTCMQDLVLQVPDRSDPVNRRKQLQAFPPNFIHSLDASHMLLSALECDERGLTFAAVHDSFWTHAGDVDVMNEVLRDAFIRIHSEDVIQRLASEFNARYKGSLYLMTVSHGSKVEIAIAEHRNKTGKKFDPRTELMEERERQRLLDSSNPDDVQKGLEMVTPASIFEQMCPNGLSTSSELDTEDDEPSPNDSDDMDNLTAARHVENMDKSHFASVLEKGEKYASRAKKNVGHSRVKFWAPLTFPEIPKKGSFDVSQLQHSKYFFS